MIQKIEECYQQYGPMVGRRCLKLLNDEDKAFDAMQEVFVKFLVLIDHKKIDYPAKYLMRMATNICLKMITREYKLGKMSGPENTIETIASNESIEDNVSNSDFLERIFASEPESTKTIAVMHFVEGLIYKDIAKEVGMSVAGVRKRMDRLKQKAKSIGWKNIL